MPRACVAAVHDLADGEMKEVEVDGAAVLLSRVEGAFYATGAHCTHYGAPLATGVLSGATVVCPWHHAVFDVTDGALVAPPAPDVLSRYAVEVEGDDVFVTVPDDAETTEKGATYRESGSETPPMADGGGSGSHVVIVGGGAAGQSAAEALRQNGFTGRVTLVVGEDTLPYDRTKLSKAYAAGQVGDEALPLRSADFYARHGITLDARRVSTLDADARTVNFSGGETLAYDAALLATGAMPRALPVPGGDAEGVHLLRSAADAHAVVQAAKHAQRAVVIGSSFIGMEAAASLKSGRGLDVTVVSMDAVPFEASLGRQVGGVFQTLHEEHGVRFHLDRGVEEIETGGDGLTVVLDDGTRATGDLVLVGVGVTPATDFVSSVDTADDGGVRVDEYLQAAPGLWAAGDLAWYPENRLGESVRIEHWRLAQQHGRIAARNIAAHLDGGEAVPFVAPPFFWSGQFGTSLRYVGHATDPEDVTIDGSLDDRDFVAYYRKNGAVVAACGVGRDKALAAFHALLATGQSLSADEVENGYDPLEALGTGATISAGA